MLDHETQTEAIVQAHNNFLDSTRELRSELTQVYSMLGLIILKYGPIALCDADKHMIRDFFETYEIQITEDKDNRCEHFTVREK